MIKYETEPEIEVSLSRFLPKAAEMGEADLTIFELQHRYRPKNGLAIHTTVMGMISLLS